MLKLTLPTSVTFNRVRVPDKIVRLNLNWYRNVNFHVNNDVKQMFKDIVGLSLTDCGFTPEPPLKFTYSLYYDCNRQVDLANVLVVVDKYTCDALKEHGLIKDDNHKIVQAVEYRWAGVDKENPRAELEVTKL